MAERVPVGHVVGIELGVKARLRQSEHDFKNFREALLKLGRDHDAAAGAESLYEQV